MIEPKNDWVLVKLHPFAEKQGSLFIIEESTVNTVRTATVVAVGPGRASPAGNRIPVGLEKGEKVAFFRWHLEHKTGKQTTRALQDLGEDLGLIRAPDILYAYLEA